MIGFSVVEWRDFLPRSQFLLPCRQGAFHITFLRNVSGTRIVYAARGRLSNLQFSFPFARNC